MTFVYRIGLLALLLCFCGTFPTSGMDQHWIDDLNTRFPNLGDEFQQAVAHKLAQYPPETSIDDVIVSLTSHPDYSLRQITNTTTFGLHSELMVLYPAVGEYEKALQEAKLLRDFVVANPPANQEVVVTFRGVYAELLIVNGRYEDALQECAESRSLAPEEEGIYLSQGVAYVHTGDLARVLENVGILVQTPDPKLYARQLFDFLLLHRHRFQNAHIQANTMIDVMLRDLAPEQRRTAITISAPTPLPTSIPSPKIGPSTRPSPASPTRGGSKKPEGDVPLAMLLAASQENQAQLLGAPISESATETALIQEFQYKNHTLTINRDKQTRKILSCSMFFLPPVSEVDAFAHIGLQWRDVPPTLLTNTVKAWTPYDSFAKVRISLNHDNVLAIVVLP